MASLVSLTPRKPLNSHFSNVPKLSRRGRGQAVRFDAARQLVNIRWCCIDRLKRHRFPESGLADSQLAIIPSVLFTGRTERQEVLRPLAGEVAFRVSAWSRGERSRPVCGQPLSE